VNLMILFLLAFSDGVITNIEAQGLKIARDSVVKEATDVKAIASVVTNFNNRFNHSNQHIKYRSK